MAEVRRRGRLAPTVVLALGLVVAPGVVAAQCVGVTWQNTAGGAWEVASNWEGNQLPGPSDAVCITAFGVYTVTVNSPVEIGSLVVDVGTGGLATLLVTNSFAPASFSVANQATIGVGGKLTLENSPFSSTGSGSLVNNGVIELGGLLVTNAGRLTLPVANFGSVYWRGYAEISGPLTTGIDSLMAPVAAVGLAHLTINQGFTNNGEIQLNDGSTHLSVRGTLTNQGDIVQLASRATDPAKLTQAVLDTELDNFGSVSVNEIGISIATPSANHRNESGGVINISVGELRFDLTGDKASSSVTNIGIIDIAAAKRAGLVGGTLTIIGGLFSPADGQISGGGNLVLHGTNVSGGVLVNESLRVEMADCVLSPATGLVNGADLVVLGVNNVNGSLSNGASGTMTVAGSNLFGDARMSFASDFVNNGILELDDFSLMGLSSVITVTAGALVNEAGAEINLRGRVLNGPSARVINAQLDNRGDLNLVDADLQLTGGAAGHSNSGRIFLDGGDLSVELQPSTGTRASSSVTNTGIIDIAASRSWNTSSSTRSGFAAPTFTNSGTIDIGVLGSMVQASVDFTNDITGELTGNGELDVSAASSAINEGSISPGSSPGRLTIRGDMIFGPTAVLNLEIEGRVVESLFDRLDVTDSVAIAGTMNVDLAPSFIPEAGDSFAVFSFASRTGGFDSSSLPPLPGGLAWSLRWEPLLLWLDVVCVEGPQLAVSISADKDPVTVTHPLSYRIAVANQSSLAASSVVVTDPLDPDLLYIPELSSPECEGFGAYVDCVLPNLAPLAGGVVTVTVSPLLPRQVSNVATVSAAECDPVPGNNTAGVDVRVVNAEPCDADASDIIDAEDPVAAVLHIFGSPASGNPDCTEDDGVNAADLAEIIRVIFGP